MLITNKDVTEHDIRRDEIKLRFLSEINYK